MPVRSDYQSGERLRAADLRAIAELLNTVEGQAASAPGPELATTVRQLQDDVANLAALAGQSVVAVVYDPANPGQPRPVVSATQPVLWLWYPTAPGSMVAGVDAWVQPSEAASTAFLASYTFDGYADGEPVSAAPAHSGSPWDAVVVGGAGAAITAAAAPAGDGLRVGRYTSGTSNAHQFTAWRSAIAGRTTATLGFKLRLPAYPSANLVVGRFRRLTTAPSTYGEAVAVRVTPTGVLQFMDKAFTTPMFSTAAPIPLDTWVRVEFGITAAGAAGRARAWVTPQGQGTEVLGDDSTARDVGTSIDEYAVGIMTSIASSHTVYVDSVRVGADLAQVF